MSQRYFLSSVAVYEAVRLSLDEAFGLPDDDTATCFSPADSGVKDASNRMLLAAEADWCDWPQVAEILSPLLASGAVAEIDEATYQAAFPALP